MKKASSLLAFWLALGLPCLANAEEELRIHFLNDTDLAVRNIQMAYSREGGSGSFGSTIHVVPGNKCTFSSDGSSLTGVTVDMGTERYDFTDCSALAGQSELELILTRDDDGTPRLVAGGSRRLKTASSKAANLPWKPVPFGTAITRRNAVLRYWRSGCRKTQVAARYGKAHGGQRWQAR